MCFRRGPEQQGAPRGSRTGLSLDRPWQKATPVSALAGCCLGGPSRHKEKPPWGSSGTRASPTVTSPGTVGHSPDPWPGPTTAPASAAPNCPAAGHATPLEATSKNVFLPCNSQAQQRCKAQSRPRYSWRPLSAAVPASNHPAIGPAPEAITKACFLPQAQPGTASSAHMRLGCSRVPDPARCSWSTAQPPARFRALTGLFLLCWHPPVLLVSGLHSSPRPSLSLSAAQLLPCAIACAEKKPL